MFFLFALGCAAEAPPSPAIAVTVSPAPVVKPATAPPDESPKPALDPFALAEKLWSKGGEPSGPDERQTVYVNTADIVNTLEAYGEAELSARLREDEAFENNSFHMNAELLCYSDTFDDGGKAVPFAAIFFNNHRSAYCLVMENRGEWGFSGYFECGEVGRYGLFGEVRTHKAQTSDKGPQAWLLVDGLVGTGTGMRCEDCTWYNLNARREDIRYITLNFDINARPIPYQITSEVRAQDQFGPDGYPVEIVYTCRFGVAPGEDWGLDTDFADIASAGEADAIIVETTQYFAWEDGALLAEGGLFPFEGGEALYNGEIPASAVIGICGQRFNELEDHGTKAEKAWAKDVRQLMSEEGVEYITLTPPGGMEHDIGRYSGFAKAPRFDYWEINSTIECSGGAPVGISFLLKPDSGYTLTRYGEDGASEIVPIDNGVFLAQKDAGTLLYTLEGEWPFGTYSYDFNVSVR